MVTPTFILLIRYIEERTATSGKGDLVSLHQHYFSITNCEGRMVEGLGIRAESHALTVIREFDDGRGQAEDTYIVRCAR